MQPKPPRLADVLPFPRRPRVTARGVEVSLVIGGLRRAGHAPTGALVQAILTTLRATYGEVELIAREADQLRLRLPAVSEAQAAQLVATVREELGALAWQAQAPLRLELASFTYGGDAPR